MTVARLASWLSVLTLCSAAVLGQEVPASSTRPTTPAELRELFAAQAKLERDLNDAEAEYAQATEILRDGGDLPKVAKAIDTNEDVRAARRRVEELSKGGVEVGPPELLAVPRERRLAHARMKLEGTITAMRAEITSSTMERLATRCDATRRRADAIAREIQRARESPTISPADDADRLAEMFAGTCDVFLTEAEINAAAPAIAGATFDGVLTIAGLQVVRLKAGDQTWTVDPSRVIAVRSRPAQ